MISAGFVSALVLNCVGGNWDACALTAQLVRPHDGQRDYHNERGDARGCVEEVSHVSNEASRVWSNSSAPCSIVRASTPFGSSCAEQARAPPEFVRTP